MFAEFMVYISAINCSICFIFIFRVAQFEATGSHTNNCISAIVYFCVELYTCTSVEFGFSMFSIFITKTSITSNFYITNAVFQTSYTNAQVVQFVREFISQTVDHSLLFCVSAVLVSHSFSYHLSHFVTSDVVLAFESTIWVTIDNTSVSQLRNCLVCPRIWSYIGEWVSCECSSYTQNCCCCKDCCELFFHS